MYMHIALYKWLLNTVSFNPHVHAYVIIIPIILLKQPTLSPRWHTSLHVYVWLAM